MQVVDDYAGGRGGRRGSEHRIVTRAGEIHWHQGMGKIVEWDADGRPLRIVGTNTDITERKVAEHKLREMNLELEQRVVERTVDLRSAIAELEQANVGKDAFMAAVSHELRTPLTGILTMSEILQSQARGPLNPQQVQYVAAIHESGQRLLATVNGVLHYTSLVGGVTPLQRENCRLVELCASAVRHVGADAEARGLQIRRTISPLDVQIESDAQGIIQILKELLENAVKFTPDGGHIDVTVMAVPEEDAVRLVVADDGIGMSAAQVATLFRPFSQGEQTLARRFGGLGLGLAYVHEMVARLGGSVAVASEPGCGSRFTVTLPALMPQWARS
jgi:signal transduction histidine kinase